MSSDATSANVPHAERQFPRVTTQRRELRPPSWLGWVAFLSALVSAGLALIPISIWAYRRGRRDGFELEEDIDPPLPNFGWAVVGWALVLLVPVLAWYAAVHLPTMCYKHGASVGRAEGYASPDYTSVAALVFWVLVTVIAAWVLIVWVALAAEEEPASDTVNIGATEIFRYEKGDCVSILEGQHSVLVEPARCGSVQDDGVVVMVFEVSEPPLDPASLAESRCPLYTTHYLYPTRETFEMGDRQFVCIEGY